MRDRGSDGRPLGEVLIDHGLADAAAVGDALTHQPQGGGARLASTLLHNGAATERALALGLAEQQGAPALVLAESTIDLMATELVPRFLATQHGLLPVALSQDTLTVAVAEIDDAAGERRAIFSQVEFASGRRVVPLLAVEAVLQGAIAQAYDAHKQGETRLVGQEARPAGAGNEPLSMVRPAVRPTGPALRDIVLPSEPDGEPELPMVLGEEDAPTRPLVFLVDDDDEIRALVTRVLRLDGYEIEEARTGREAMERLRVLRPALILLDAMLPEVHGYDICRLVKASATFTGVPVVMISAVLRGFADARTMQEVHAADAFVEKPFDIHYLRQVVARLLGRELPRNNLSHDWRKKVLALREAAVAAWGRGDLGGAEDAVRRWRTLDPFDADLYVLQGNLRHQQGDVDGALKAYERAAAFDPGSFSALHNLAIAYERLGFTRRAAQAWYRAYELAPDPGTRQQIEAHLGRSS
jgi:CheY-like chemotaxis protein